MSRDLRHPGRVQKRCARRVRARVALAGVSRALAFVVGPCDAVLACRAGSPALASATEVTRRECAATLIAGHLSVGGFAITWLAERDVPHRRSSMVIQSRHR